jgi:hypothetical protein
MCGAGTNRCTDEAIDALLSRECTMRRDGVMHACGHDIINCSKYRIKRNSEKYQRRGRLNTDEVKR